MTKRIISAAVGIALGILMFLLDFRPLYLVVITVFSLMAVYEVLLATKYLQNKVLTVVSLVFVCFAPLMFTTKFLRNNIAPISLAFILALFVVMLAMHEVVSFAQISIVAVVSICIPMSFSSFLFMRIGFPEHGVFFMLFVLFASWFSDSGAYFAGTFFGKHKMSPKISPKKTWEGFFGGIIVAAIAAYLLGVGYEIYDVVRHGAHTFVIDKPFLAAAAAVCAVFGVLGDLSASLVKRQCSVKDFGNIMPGHGGILDRFDSVLFVAPFVYQLIQVYCPIKEI